MDEPLNIVAVDLITDKVLWRSVWDDHHGKQVTGHRPFFVFIVELLSDDFLIITSQKAVIQPEN